MTTEVSNRMKIPPNRPFYLIPAKCSQSIGINAFTKLQSQFHGNDLNYERKKLIYFVFQGKKRKQIICRTFLLFWSMLEKEKKS